MTLGVTIETSIIPSIVFATAVPTVNAATKLKNAAHTTAVSGLRTRVPTIVAIELAESWKPLMKSNTKAIPMIARMYSTTAYEFLREMPSSTIATVWQRSSVSSMVS